MPDPLHPYPRAARIQLVRWSEVEGLPFAALATRAAERWPRQPALVAGAWTAWVSGTEFGELRRLVLETQAQRERLGDLSRAAGGSAALGDLADAAAYALAIRALQLVEEIEDPRLLGPLMRTVRDAKALAVQGLRDDVAAEHRAELARRDAEIADLKARLAARAPDASGLRPETIEELERRLKLL